MPVVVVVILAAFVISSMVRHLWQRIRARSTAAGESFGAAFGGIVRREPGYWGGQLSHLGLALAAVAIATTSSLAVREEVRIDLGEAVVVDDYCFVYEGIFSEPQAHRTVTGVDIRLFRDDCTTELDLLRPSVNRYPNSTQPIGTPAVRTGLVDDVYVTITSGDADRVGLDIFVFPLMWLLWAGGMITVAGGLWAFLMRREPLPPDNEPQSDVVSARAA